MRIVMYARNSSDAIDNVSAQIGEMEEFAREFGWAGYCAYYDDTSLAREGWYQLLRDASRRHVDIVLVAGMHSTFGTLTEQRHAEYQLLDRDALLGSCTDPKFRLTCQLLASVARGRGQLHGGRGRDHSDEVPNPEHQVGRGDCCLF